MCVVLQSTAQRVSTRKLMVGVVALCSLGVSAYAAAILSGLLPELSGSVALPVLYTTCLLGQVALAAASAAAVFAIKAMWQQQLQLF